MLTRVVRTEPENDVSVVWNGNSVLGRWQIELSIEQTSLVEVQRVFQIDLLHVLVRGTAYTDYVESVAVQVERMRQIRLLHCKELIELFSASVRMYKIFVN